MSAGLAAVTLSAGAASSLAAAVPPQIAGARLAGQFLMHGRVTVAVRIRGERVGQRAHRAWTFSSACPVGQCQSVRLVRQRTGGIDSLTLKLISPGRYEGNGKFYVPLRCDGRLYRRGESVPFTIGVRITAAAPSAATFVATAVRASYTNRARRNLTPCVAIPGHDSATYSGQLTVPSGGAGA